MLDTIAGNTGSSVAEASSSVKTAKALDAESVADVESSLLSVNSKTERKLVLKLDFYLIPLLGILRMAHQYERTVITNAKLGGLLEDLSMSPAQYRLCLSIFYVGYILFDVPCNIIIRRWRPSVYFAFITLTWGIIAMASAASTNYVGMVICRFLMGIFEAGYLPGTAYYLSLWYTRQEYSKRVGYLYIVSCFAGATGGLIAYGISQISTERLNIWQWMFIIEGAPCIVLAAIAYFFIPDHPKDARFLDQEERSIAERRVAIDQGAAGDISWSWTQVKSIFTDWKTYIFTFVYITTSISGTGLTLTLPSIIDGMGSWGPKTSLALTTPPYAVACIFIFVATWSSDKFFERSLHLLSGNLLMTTGILLMMFASYDSLAVQYFAICLAFASSQMLYPIKTAWYSNNYSGLTRRAVANGVMHSFGSIGSAIGGQIYFDEQHHYFWGNTIAFICLLSQNIAILILRFALDRINKKRDTMTQEEKVQSIAKYDDPELIGDRHPDYRYVL